MQLMADAYKAKGDTAAWIKSLWKKVSLSSLEMIISSQI